MASLVVEGARAGADTGMGADGGGAGAEASEEGLGLYTPAGWFHWLVGDAPSASPADDWHVVFGGSYPPPGGPIVA